MCRSFSQLPLAKSFRDGEHPLPPLPVELTDNKPIAVQNRPVPHQLRPAIEKATQEMLDADVIEPSMSPYSFPMIMVPKKTGTLRPCVDFRRLNLVTIKDVYPLPRIDDTLDALHGARYFTCLDLKSGYWQFPIAVADRPKLAFTVPRGHFQFRVMPFGLSNAPAAFQRVMDRILMKFKWKFCLVYLDDIIIFSRTWEEHIEHCREVFTELERYQLTLQIDKCKFGQMEVHFLGHVVTNGTIKPDPDKIRAIEAFAVPRNVTDVQRFLGLANFYRKFIPDFAQTAVPLYQLLRGPRISKRHGRAGQVTAAEFIWGDDQQTAFDKLRRALIHDDCVLHCPDFTQPFRVYSDASDKAIGAVLAQRNADTGDERPIAFISRVLSIHESRYSVTQKECLAAVWAVKSWRTYLLGTDFELFTDHVALQWLMKLNDAPNQRLARWILSLQEFRFRIIHKKGQENVVADCLSRPPDVSALSPVTVEPVHSTVPTASLGTVDTGHVYATTTEMGWRDALTFETFEDGSGLTLQLMPRFDAQRLHAFGGWSTGAYVASAVRINDSSLLQFSRTHARSRLDFEQRQRLRDMQDNDPFCTSVRQWASDPATFARSHPADAKSIEAMELTIHEGTVMKTLSSRNAMVPYIPLALRREVLDYAHGANGTGHYSGRYLIETLSNVCWWPTMSADAISFVNNCVGCALSGPKPAATPPKLGMPVPTQPFELIGLDCWRDSTHSSAVLQSVRVNVYAHSQLCTVTDM